MPRQSNKVSITQEQKEILLGILIGDAHMELASSGRSARLKIEQESKKRDYVEHLHQIFESWSPGDIAPASNSNNLRFSTRYSPSLTFYHTSFYGDKGRTLPRWLEHSFTARSLAYLIMDDGGTKSKDSKAVYINVYGLDRRRQEFLCEILGRRFKLQAKVVRDRQYCRIYISGHSYEALVALIDPYILPSLRHKIPPSPQEEGGGRRGPFGLADATRTHKVMGRSGAGGRAWVETTQLPKG